MKLKIKQVDIPPADPFQNDVLNRKESAEILTQLISSLDEPSVIAIDAPWGFGKTTFMRMFRQYLISQGFNTLYFNAWENDFVVDALASLIGEIEAGLDDLILARGQKSTIKRKVTQLKRIASYLGRKSAPVAIRLLTAGIVDTEEIYEQAIKDISETIAREQIENYEKAKRNFSNFKDKLSEFVKTLGENNNRPIAFFIDELDRCRPNYAVEILEKAKHLFSVNGFVFVIAIDKKQISHSIRSIYGQGMDVDGYLRRFIDFDYRLPISDNREFAKFLFNQYEYANYFSNRSAEDNSYASDVIIDMFAELSILFGFSLRVQEQCFGLLTVTLLTSAKNEKIHPHLLVFLLMLKNVNLPLYERYVENLAEAYEIFDFLRELPGGSHFLNEHLGSILEAYIVAGRNIKQEISKFKENYRSILNSQSADDITKERANSVLSFIEDLRYREKINHVSKIAKKIDISDRFI